MKKYISYITVLFSLMAFTACSEDNGTEPGSDSQPATTIYTYEPSAPLNPDNDINIRFVCNNKTNEAYYLAEKTEEKEARKMSEAAYADYVAANGEKLQLTEDQHSGGKVSEVTIKDMFGEYTITVVAVNGSTKASASKKFTGLMWEDVVTGTYMYGNAFMQTLMEAEASPTTLQICTTDETLYRFKDVFGEGKHVKINLLPNLVAEDEDGFPYTFFRVKDQVIGQSEGNNVSVRDIGYWQGDDMFVTDYGYESGMYEDYFCFIYIQYRLGSSNKGYGYDYFVPDEEDEE